jgi:hypothetical protein
MLGAPEAACLIGAASFVDDCMHRMCVAAGATSVVFECTWPSRFGPNTILAAKLLSDPIDPTGYARRCFMHEASVLKYRRYDIL